MTDGILLNEIQEDPLLRAYDAILIDEAHERSLNIDFILGFLRQLAARRAEPKNPDHLRHHRYTDLLQGFDGAPIIEVSGRMYPVDQIYRPIESIERDKQLKNLTFVEACVEVITDILQDNQAGDILAFLPGERDIHEARKLLENSPARACDILPLFGRMANADQQRIFHPGKRRRVILSTNIAETSLTVPGIRYVVDSGMARISRYSPHSRTQRLPIEPVAQSSADQRKGRCGRVSNGICYRLYSEEDYHERPRYSTPEIHRSNLAAVILRMLAFRLGDVRHFPFIDPPSDPAIRGGYRLLAELGAVRTASDSDLEDAYRLTPLGRRLARLPVDPTVARMLLEAQHNRCVADVLVIAAGLSIQDPRERPAELAQEADAIQRRFIHKDSDFLSLLNIWNKYHEEMEQLSQRKLRKFCTDHFLSFQRMREWRDIHHQLGRILKDLKILQPDSARAGPDTNYAPPQIHPCRTTEQHRGQRDRPQLPGPRPQGHAVPDPDSLTTKPPKNNAKQPTKTKVKSNRLRLPHPTGSSAENGWRPDAPMRAQPLRLTYVGSRKSPAT